MTSMARVVFPQPVVCFQFLHPCTFFFTFFFNVLFFNLIFQQQTVMAVQPTNGWPCKNCRRRKNWEPINYDVDYILAIKAQMLPLNRSPLQKWHLAGTCMRTSTMQIFGILCKIFQNLYRNFLKWFSKCYEIILKNFRIFLKIFS